MTISILKTEAPTSRTPYKYVLSECQTPKPEHVEAMRSMSPDLELLKIVLQHELSV
jgi:hypothetical protein